MDNKETRNELRFRATKISKNKGHGGGAPIIGYGLKPPVIGDRFAMWSGEKNHRGRHLWTSTVVGIEGDVITTKNSIYRIEEIPEGDPL